jgi:hypothetical protein
MHDVEVGFNGQRYVGVTVYDQNGPSSGWMSFMMRARISCNMPICRSMTSSF